MGRWGRAALVSHKFARLVAGPVGVERCPRWAVAGGCCTGRPCEPVRRSSPWCVNRRGREQRQALEWVGAMRTPRAPSRTGWALAGPKWQCIDRTRTSEGARDYPHWRCQCTRENQHSTHRTGWSYQSAIASHAAAVRSDPRRW